jgi:hypothetical protein
VTQSGPITGIEIWGSWYKDILPDGGAEDVSFTLSIHSDSSGKPGTDLWSRTFTNTSFIVASSDGGLQGFYFPGGPKYRPDNHTKVFKYSFSIDSSNTYVVSGSSSSPQTYWLEVQAHVLQSPTGQTTRFGWKAAIDHWNHTAVTIEADAPHQGSWNLLRYPAGHPDQYEGIDLALGVTIGAPDSEPEIRRMVLDDWQCQGDNPVTGVVWWGSYIGYGYTPCSANSMTAPAKPDAFLLSIWSDVPDPNPSDSGTFSHPGQQLWEHEATDVHEVMVGYDKYPHDEPHEPVFRYSFSIPEDQWFQQYTAEGIYWFGVVAVYEDADAVVYPWGWTNHMHVFNDDAVEGELEDSAWQWQPLKDQTGASADMSFILFTEPK